MYKSLKHEIIGVTPAKLYFAQDFRLSIDLLRGNLSETRELED